jgi:hypothetical protein
MLMVPDRLAGLTLLLVLVRVVLNNTEALVGRSEYQAAGTFSWSVRKAGRSWTSHGKIARLLDLGLAYPSYLWLISLQLACALFIIAVPASARRVLPIVLAIELLSTLRNIDYGTDGSDRMHLVVLCAITMYFTFSTPAARMIVLWFIAVQAMTAYFTSGVVKLQSRAWRDGTAIEFVLMSENYGDRTFSRRVAQIPHMNQVLCWSTIIFECCFPFVVLLGPKATLVLLSCGIVFHLSIAATMGLNGFFWSFVATYPAVLRLSVDFQTLVH